MLRVPITRILVNLALFWGPLFGNSLLDKVLMAKHVLGDASRLYSSAKSTWMLRGLNKSA